MQRRVEGIIPARAGNTATCRGGPAGVADHPRACGEHSASLSRRPTIPGSSPRVRGTPFPYVFILIGTRIIPARAGNTDRAGHIQPQKTDHPRACGEHQLADVPSVNNAGSSPRVRGTLREHDPNEVQERIIPARAGNTANASRDDGFHPDHPRACGEHFIGSPFCSIHAGSSPRVRGTRLTAGMECLRYRIIPARAGNTFWITSALAIAADHPRACGEHD